MQDYEFLVSRERHERRIAEQCSSPEARTAHVKMADEYAARAASLREQDGGHFEGVALMADETDAANVDQTRTAGPESIRDRSVGRAWDEVDEASDESFPASDPPSIP